MSVLVDYTLALYPQQEYATGETPARLQQCLISFINKQISLDKAKSIIRSLNLSTDPIDKLNHILNIESAPLSSSNSIAIRQSQKLKLKNHNDSSNTKQEKQKTVRSESSDNNDCQDSDNLEDSDIEISDNRESTIPNRKKSHCWTSSEDERLLAAVHRYGIDNWSSVAHFVGNARTRSQCSQRWFRGIDPRLSKNLWTHEEDNMLISLVSYYGDRSWTKVASKLGNRSDVQCRYHYKQIHRDFQSHAHAAANFFNNNSTRIKNIFQKQQDQQQIQGQQGQLQPDQQQFQFQNQQQFSYQNQQQQLFQTQFQNQQKPFQPQMQESSLMNMQPYSQMNNFNGFNNNMNGMNNCFSLNRMQSQVNYNQIQIPQPNMNSLPNAFMNDMGNSTFMAQQSPQVPMMNWSTNSSYQQQNSFLPYQNQFSNNSGQFQTQISNMNSIGNQRLPNSIEQPRLPANKSEKQEEQKQQICEAESSHAAAAAVATSDVVQKRPSSNNEPAIFELDDSDLFSKEAMALFSIPGEKDYLFF